MLPPQPNPELYQFDLFESILYSGPVIAILFILMVAIAAIALISIFFPIRGIGAVEFQGIRMLPALIGLVMTAYCLYILMPVPLESYDFHLKNALPGVLEAFGFTLLGASTSALIVLASIAYSFFNPPKPNKDLQDNLHRSRSGGV